MVAIQEPLFNVLKKVLAERYVPHLLPLLGNANQENKAEKQVARALSAFAIHAKFGLDPKSSAKLVVDDYNDNGVDAIYYHEQDKTLYIIQSKLKETEQFQLAEAQAFLSGAKLIIDKQFQSFDRNVQNLATQITDWLDKCDQIKLLIAYTGDAVSIQASNEMRRVIQAAHDDGEEQLQLEVEIFGPQDIESVLRQENAIKLVNDKIRIHKYRVNQEAPYTVFGLVKLLDLVELHKKHGKGLYEKNIRYFLGAGRRGVNSAIKQTLISEPQHFLHLNNGITMVGSSIKQKGKSQDNATTRTFEVTAMSVVNGAQTISTVAEYLAENPQADIVNAQVMLTLITGTDGFHKKVTRARNLQNPVDISNFAALDDNQERLRQEMALYGVEYIYRPQQNPNHGVKSIQIDELAKALACMHKDITFAAKLKFDPSQFTAFDNDAYQKIFETNISGLAAINAVLFYREIQRYIQTQKGNHLLYRHCGYVFASILMKSLRNKILEAAPIISAEIANLITHSRDELRQILEDVYSVHRYGAAHHAFFKRIGDTSRLMQAVMISWLNLGDDKNVQALKARSPAHDPHNQALSNYLFGKVNQL